MHFTFVRSTSCALLVALFAATLAAPEARAQPLRVVTYNVARGKFFTKLLRPAIRNAFRRNRDLRGAHIFALQEACLQHTSESKLFEDLVRDAHGAAYSFGARAYPNPPKSGCETGQLIVSAFPILDSGRIQLPLVGHQRSAGWTDLQVPDAANGRLRVYSLHLSNRDGKNMFPIEGRWKQAQLVLDHLQQYQRDYPGSPVLVMGDFNALAHLYNPWVKEKTIQEFSRVLDPSLNGFRITAVIPYMLDWIFQDGLHKLRSSVEPVIFSDHLPVVADYETR